jgi:hypothetical protein
LEGNSDAITPIIKEGFILLNKLDLINWYGDVRLFIENTPIPNLKFFVYYSDDTSPDKDIDIVDEAVTNYGRSLLNLNLTGYFISSINLVKISECCRGLEKLILSITEDDDILSFSKIKIIASLPRLNIKWVLEE